MAGIGWLPTARAHLIFERFGGLFSDGSSVDH
jgi:hypothetical protein